VLVNELEAVRLPVAVSAAEALAVGVAVREPEAVSLLDAVALLLLDPEALAEADCSRSYQCNLCDDETWSTPDSLYPDT